MDLSHDSSTILGQLRKGQAETNGRLDAIRVELQRLNVHLEQLAAAVVRAEEPSRPYVASASLAQFFSTLRPRALSAWARVQTLPRDLRTGKPHHRPVAALRGQWDGGPGRGPPGRPTR